MLIPCSRRYIRSNTRLRITRRSEGLMRLYRLLTACLLLSSFAQAQQPIILQGEIQTYLEKMNGVSIVLHGGRALLFDYGNGWAGVVSYVSYKDQTVFQFPITLTDEYCAGVLNVARNRVAFEVVLPP